MRSILLFFIVLRYIQGFTTRAAELTGGATCPVPLTTRGSCPLCSSNTDCVQLTQNVESTCYKGVVFLAESTVKSYRCTFVGPADLAAAVSGAYFQCSAGSGSGGDNGEDGPSCILGLVVSGSPIQCEARQCTILPNSSRVDCRELECQCLSSVGCSSGHTATQILRLGGKLTWECKTQAAQPTSHDKLANCTLAAAGLPGAAAQAVCDVGECLVQGVLEEAGLNGFDAATGSKEALDSVQPPPERSISKGLELSGAATCPVAGPFGTDDDCRVCSTRSDCAQQTKDFASNCYKGVEFVAESLAKSYRCNFVGPAAFAAAVSPGAYIQCSTGSYSKDGAGGPPCAIGLALSGSSILCDARLCTTMVNSSRVECKEVECRCFPSCSTDTAADQLLALSGELAWECRTQDAQAVSGDKPANCTLAAAGLPGGAVQAVCDVGECFVQGQVPGTNTDGIEELLAFKSSLDNGDEALPDWTRENGSPCEWEGIGCDASDRVTRINLVNRGLVGSIPYPDGWAFPPTLLSLDLSRNAVRGQLPPGWVPPRLPGNLLRLVLPYCQLSGTISPEWASSLPSELSYIDFAWNQLRGSIPVNWTLPRGLTFLSLRGNNLTGNIPPTWGLPSSLTRLSLSNNKLSGWAIPPELSLPESLEWLEVESNDLSGPVEQLHTLPPSLVYLYANNNSITGSIPADWVLPGGLTHMSLTDNDLTGSIPPTWGLPSSLITLALSRNKLTGWAIPPGLSLPERLEWLEVESNNITGPVEQFRSLPLSLVYLFANNNSITGSIPADWVLPPGLQALALGDNRITGSIPTAWEIPESMNMLPEAGIEMTASLDTFRRVAILVLYGNQLTGTLPTWGNRAETIVNVKPGNPGICGKVPLTPNYVRKVIVPDSLEYSHRLLLSLPPCDSDSTINPDTDEGSTETSSTGTASKTAALVGGVVGGCVVLAMAGFVVWRRRKRRGMRASQAEGTKCASDEENQEEEENIGPNVNPGSQHADPSSDPVHGPCMPLDRALRPPIKPSPFQGYSTPSAAGSSTRATDATEVVHTPTVVSAAPGRHFGSSTDEGAASRRSASTAAMSQLLGSDPLLATIVGRLKVSSQGSSSAPSSALAEMSYGAHPPGSVGQLETRAMPNPVAGARQAPGNRPGRQGGHLVDVEIWLLDFLDLQLTKQIGSGSFGRVYMAHWNGIVVACKLLLGEAAKMGDVEKAAASVLSLSSSTLHNLRREAGLMAALRHPHVLGFIGLCTQPPCLVSEWCPRGSLYDVMRAAKTDPALAAELTWPVRLRMASEAAFGMVYLHNFRPPILHRDLKSNNLLLTETFSAKVGDFNLSKAMDQDASVASSAASFGNPRWMAPEVIAGDAHSFASDIYSFGIVLWEVLTMSLPWGSSSFWQVASDVSMGIRPPIPTPGELPPGVEESAGLDAYTGLMSRCWAHRAADRPTFAEVAAELRAIAEMDLAR